MPRTRYLISIAAALTACGILMARIKDDERVILFPTYAHVDGETATVNVHGWIFEPEEDSVLRSALARAVRRLAGLAPSTEEAKTLDRRLRWFLVDNERGKKIRVRVGSGTFELPRSGKNGHFEGAFRIPVNAFPEGRPRGSLTCSTVETGPDGAPYAGEIQVLEPEGLSVISDIDDTIKISDVVNGKELIKNTFYRRFRPVPGMAAFYAGLRAKGASFHYVSGSPWQLYSELAAFVTDEGFPEGTFHLKPFRAKDFSGLEFVIGDQRAYKRSVISAIMDDLPRRRFILIGDSGEQDPEVYADLAAAYPTQVEAIYIRRLEGADDDRFDRAFADLPETTWTVFAEPPTEQTRPR